MMSETGNKVAQMQQSNSVRSNEIAHFDRMAATWWDLAGPMNMLHKMNPLRVGWIDRRVTALHSGRGRLLDVGCGAGLASEALARMGYDVLGIDAAAETIGAARAHAGTAGLALEYRIGAAEDLAQEGLLFPVITALEVIEHVADSAAFLQTLSRLLQPAGLLFVSTLNRTARSWITAKLGAEYIARLLPVGTHQWSQFVTPNELASKAKRVNLMLKARSGLSFDPLGNCWFTSQDIGVNYIAMLERQT